MKAKYVLWLNSKVIDSFFGRIFVVEKSCFIAIIMSEIERYHTNQANPKGKKNWIQKYL